MISYRKADILERFRPQQTLKEFVQDLIKISPAYTVAWHDDHKVEFGYRGNFFTLSDKSPGWFRLFNDKLKMLWNVNKPEEVRDIIVNYVTNKQGSLISYREADILDRVRPVNFTVHMKYHGYKLQFAGITTDEEMENEVLNKWKYLEDLIYSSWEGATRDGNNIYKKWEPDGPTLPIMIRDLMISLKGKPRILDVYELDIYEAFNFGVTVE